MSDNLGREAAVLFMEMPEAWDLMDQIRAAGECIGDAAATAKEELDEIRKERDQEEGEAQDDETATADDSKETVKGSRKAKSHLKATEGGEDEGPEGSSEDFAADEEEKDGNAISRAAEEAKNCIGVVDQWTIGKISGRVFKKFFDNALKTQ